MSSYQNLSLKFDGQPARYSESDFSQLIEDLDGILNVPAPVRFNEYSEETYRNNASLSGHFAPATLVDEKKVRVYIQRQLNCLALALIELANEVKFRVVKKVPDL